MEFLVQFVLFGVAGAVGFLVDTGVLYLLKGSLGLYAARLVSFTGAALTTWLFNRTITFRSRKSGRSPQKEFSIYFGLMLVGGAMNYAVYAWLVAGFASVASHPVVGVAAGSLAGMFINLCTSRFALYRFQHR